MRPYGPKTLFGVIIKVINLLKSTTKIAVIELHGTIGNQVKDKVYAGLFEKVALNKKYKSVVIDIDSPGGSASASHNLYENVRILSKSKPVVAYIRGLGASGGYYVACGATRIIASRAALVGSIGVIYMRPVVQQLMDKLGVEMSVFKSGAMKDMHGFWRQPTEEESEKFRELISKSYGLFLETVCENRNISTEEVIQLSTGELFTAQYAKDTKLIDHVGNYYDALSLGMNLSNSKGKLKIKNIKPKRSLADKLSLFPKQEAYMNILNELQPLTRGGLYYLKS